ncbi:hypothetical protein CFP71_27875 [Amycolatopsis thailandensis]|uniref:Uncharacterized protein n=1 Tax=Amycolatopsis thailandensis TaxID=589330 RepID=A0A229RUD6_9PSEU|nr:hypothetical protein [Amycolatopsis thailandensis]OXM50256.1 hypothetical protein CFP71_27875 [Amycolatopsis thailandensis]
MPQQVPRVVKEQHAKFDDIVDTAVAYATETMRKVPPEMAWGATTGLLQDSTNGMDPNTALMHALATAAAACVRLAKLQDDTRPEPVP